MATVTVHEAKTNLSKLIVRAMGGEEVIIARGKEPTVRLVPVERGGPAAKPRRQFGAMKGMFEVDDAAFAPLTDEELKDWGL